MSTVYYFDCQCFRVHDEPENTFIIKEACIIKGNNIISFLFKPTKSFHDLDKRSKESVRWLSTNLHGLSWNSGRDSLEDFKKEIKNEKGITVYVKGYEKKSLLKKFFDKIAVIDLEDLGCPSLKVLERTTKMEHPCKFHNNYRFKCAVINALMIRQWHEGLDQITICSLCLNKLNFK
jgi:hypothetical protein